LLFADPPYRIDSAQVSVVFTQLANAGALAPDALVVYEHAAGTELPVPEGFTDETTRLYGSTGVTVARFGR
jgi:16S rRNA (guanine966-N2)-methyltransferase